MQRVDLYFKCYVSLISLISKSYLIARFIVLSDIPLAIWSGLEVPDYKGRERWPRPFSRHQLAQRGKMKSEYHNLDFSY